MKLTDNIDLGKAFEYFKAQVQDIELELRIKNGETGAYAYAYGRIKESARFLIQQCTEPEPNDIPDPLFSATKFDEVEKEIEQDKIFFKNDPH